MDILERIDILEARKKKLDPLSQLWMDYSDAYSSADYYENEGSRKGVSPKSYYKEMEKIKKQVAKEYGVQVADAMEHHADLLADYWYMGDGRGKGAATNIRKKYKIGGDWY